MAAGKEAAMHGEESIFYALKLARILCAKPMIAKPAGVEASPLAQK